MTRIPRVALITLLLLGCQATGGRTPEAIPVFPPENSEVITPSSRPDPVAEEADPEVAALISDLTIESRDSAAGSAHLVKVARRLLHDYDYPGAERKLREAVRLDPTNAEARRLLDQVGFMLGDRSHEIYLVAKELGDQEVVRRHVQLADLERWVAEGVQLLEAGEPEAATRLFKRVLDHIEWFHQKRSPKIDRAALARIEKEALRSHARATQRKP